MTVVGCQNLNTGLRVKRLRPWVETSGKYLQSEWAGVCFTLTLGFTEASYAFREQSSQNITLTTYLVQRLRIRRAMPPLVSATSWSLVQRSPTECGVSKSVIVKPRKMRRPRPPRGCRAIGKKMPPLFRKSSLNDV